MLLNDPKMKPYAAIYTPETVAVVALLHDVCKVDVYTQEEDGSYSYNDPFPIGHGEKSIYYIQRFMKLGFEEATAIRWHMGAYDKAARSDLRDLDKAFKKSPLAVMLHIADMMATHFDEREEIQLHAAECPGGYGKATQRKNCGKFDDCADCLEEKEARV